MGRDTARRDSRLQLPPRVFPGILRWSPSLGLPATAAFLLWSHRDGLSAAAARVGEILNLFTKSGTRATTALLLGLNIFLILMAYITSSSRFRKPWSSARARPS